MVLATSVTAYLGDYTFVWKDLSTIDAKDLISVTCPKKGSLVFLTLGLDHLS